MVRINKIRVPPTSSAVEKIHVETGIYIKHMHHGLNTLYSMCRKLLGWSNSAKGIYHMNRAFIDLKIVLDNLICEEVDFSFPATMVYYGKSDDLEEFIKNNRQYKVNFKVGKLEDLDKKLYLLSIDPKKRKSDKLTIEQHRVIEKINYRLAETLAQLNLLLNHRNYDKKNQRRLFLAIGRISKWYTPSKDIFNRSIKKCDKMRKTLRQILISSKNDPKSRFYGVPREIIRIIFEYVW